MNYSGHDTVLPKEAGLPVRAPDEALRADFESVVTEHRAYLLRVAVASTRNPADAEDVVQEALMRGFRGLRTFRGECSLRTWLARIVIRVSINHHRSLVRTVKRWVLIGDLQRADSAPVEDTLDAPRATQIDPVVVMDVARQVERLPDAFRIPLLLFASNGMTIPEIAGMLEIPEGTVKSRIFYARKRLKKGLKL